LPYYIQALLIEVGETVVVSVNEEFPLDEIMMPMLDCKEDREVLLLIS
jgi:hypothetical protein